MAYNIKGGFDAIKRYAIDGDGDYKLQSLWTHSDTIELPGGEPLTNMVNRGVYYNNEEETSEYVEDNIVIDDTTTALDKVWSSQKTDSAIQNIINDSLTRYDTTWSSQKIQNKLDEGATSASKLTINGTDVDAGDQLKPVYFDDGVPVAFPMSMYAINKSSNQSFIASAGWYPPMFVLVGKKAVGDMVAAFIDYTGTVSYLKQNDALATVGYLVDDHQIRVINHSNQKISIMIWGMNNDSLFA